MTTTPNPTAAEHERVLAFFQSEEACAFGDDLTKALCYLDLKAQLAESERARDVLVSGIGCALHNLLSGHNRDCRAVLERLIVVDGRQHRPRFNRVGVQTNDVIDAIRRETGCTDSRRLESAGFLMFHLFNAEYDPALAADQTTARESAESTAEETMTDDTTAMGPEDFGGTDEGSHYMSQERVASARVTAGAKGYVPFTLKGKPAQPPEPVEPSDKPNRKSALKFLNEAFAAFSPGYEWSTVSVDMFLAEQLRCYRAGIAAERAELNAVTENGELKVELERVRAELATAHADIRTLSNAAHAESLRAQARARRVPTREALAEAIQQAITQRDQNDGDWFDKYLRAADAVLRLFAEEASVPLREGYDVQREGWQKHIVTHHTTMTAYQEARADGYRAAMTALGFQDSGGGGSADAAGNQAASAPSGSVGLASAQPSPPVTDNEPPDPFIREAPPDSEIGQYHELDRGDPGVRWFDTYSGPGPDGCATWGGADGWRMDGSVRGWRRADSAAPEAEAEPEPTPKALTAKALHRWQNELAAQPGVWAVFVTYEGEREQTGNLYDSREAAELEVEFLRRHGNRSAKVSKLGCLHNMKLSRERWADEGATNA